MRGWKRLGVVLSVVWLVAFGLWVRHESQEQAWIASGNRNCGHEADARREGWRQANPQDLGRRLKDVDEWERACERTAAEVFLERTGTVWDHLVIDARSIANEVAGGGRALLGRWVGEGFHESINKGTSPVRGRERQAIDHSGALGVIASILPAKLLAHADEVIE